MKILVPIDHTTASAQVIDAISQTLWTKESQFKIVHVLLPLEHLGTPSNISSKEWHNSLTAAQDNLKRSATQLLQGFVKELKLKFPDCEFSFHLFEHENLSVDAVILDIANDWQPDLIVIGSHGKQGLSRLLLGSVSFSVLCQSRCSVRIIKRSAFTSSDNAFNVLVAVDPTLNSDSILEWLRLQCWHPETNFRLFTVLPDLLSDRPIPVSGRSALDALAKEQEVLIEASETLRNSARFVSGHLKGDYKVDSLAVRGDARDMIIEESYTWPASLIVMGSHTKTFFKRVFLGSVSSAVALASPCSVEIVRTKTSVQ